MGEVANLPGRVISALSAPVPLSAKHDVSKFDCGEPQLNNWLRQRAAKNESRYSRTYVVGSGDRVVAYYCIAAASRSIGIGAVLVHAKDEPAKRFYLSCAEFTEFPADSRRLFLPIETVIAGFA